jgi:hypothetical protein
MSSNEALMKTLRLHALLADGTDIAQRAVDERRFALERFTWPPRNVTGVGLAPPVVDDRPQGRCGDRPVVAFSGAALAA